MPILTNTTNLEASLEPDNTFWQDSARTTSASSTDPVGSWDDDSGNSNHFTEGTTSNKPTLGSSLVSFDGGDTLANSAIGTLATAKADLTMYMLVEVSSFATNRRLFQFTNGSHYLNVYFSSGGLPTMQAIGSTTVGVGGTTLSTGTKYIFTVRVDGTNAYLYVDGTLDITVALPTTLTLNNLYLMNSRFKSQGLSGDVICFYYFHYIF